MFVCYSTAHPIAQVTLSQQNKHVSLFVPATMCTSPSLTQ